jgi:hypothetical protein
LKAYIFVPLYNIEVQNKDILDKQIDGLSIISNDIFRSKYEKFINHIMSNDFLCSLNEDITIPRSGMLVTRQFAKYLLVKECELSEYLLGTKNYNQMDFKTVISELKMDFEKFILAARLVQKGRIQIHKGYFFSTLYYSQFQLHSSSNLENISPYYFYLDKTFFEPIYNINLKIFNHINKEISILNKLKEENLVIPMLYFQQYYNAINLSDRVIKLAIILESTMLANTNSELKYRLGIRTSKFLNKDVKGILENFYDIRSSIVHNGEIINIRKKLKSYIDNIDNNNSDTEILFYFIQNQVEPIVREILSKAFLLFSEDNNINNFEALTDKLEKDIINSFI